MPYCINCGKEIKDEDRFCSRCGAPTAEYDLKRWMNGGRGFFIGRLIVVVIGVILLAASIGLIAVGGGVVWVRQIFPGSEDFIITREAVLKADSYAIVAQGIDIDISPAPRVSISGVEDVESIRLVAWSNDPSKEAFIGVAREEDAAGYLSGVWYDEMERPSWLHDPLIETSPPVSYVTHPGSAPETPPTNLSFWVVYAPGSKNQILEWVPKGGRYWMLAMNEDGSNGVDITVHIGVKLHILHIVENILVGSVFVTLLSGGLLIYVGAFRLK